MPTTAQPEGKRDPFDQAQRICGDLFAWARGEACELDHVAFEIALRQRGFELLLGLYQANLDLRFERELLLRKPSEGLEQRVRERALETLFGTARVRRLAFSPRRLRRGCTQPQARPGRRRRSMPRVPSMPADRRLSLPPDRFSLPVRELVARYAARGSFDAGRELLRQQTAAHVPHAQAMALARYAAQDVAAFYVERPTPSNDTLSPAALEVMSADGKGVRMRPEGLREDTCRQGCESARTC